MIGLAVLSYSMDEIMKMNGGIFLSSNPLGSYEQSNFSGLVAKLKIVSNFPMDCWHRVGTKRMTKIKPDELATGSQSSRSLQRSAFHAVCSCLKRLSSLVFTSSVTRRNMHSEQPPTSSIATSAENLRVDSSVQKSRSSHWHL